MEPNQLAKDLIILSKFILVKEFWMVGGEPLLHPKIVELIEVARKSKIAERIGVLTNGLLLNRMTDEFWSSISLLQVSIYPTLPESTLPMVQEKSKKHGFEVSVCGLKKDWFKLFKRVPDDGVKSYSECRWRCSCWTVHDGFFYVCPQSAFFTDAFMGLPQSLDGLPIDEHLTEQKLIDRTNSQVPYSACRICESWSTTMPWHQCSTLEEWIKDSTI